jgi:hypothetical protein
MSAYSRNGVKTIVVSEKEAGVGKKWQRCQDGEAFRLPPFFPTWFA